MVKILIKIKYDGCSAFRNGYDPFPTSREDIIYGYWAIYQEIDGQKSATRGQAERVKAKRDEAKISKLIGGLLNLPISNKRQGMGDAAYQEVLADILDNDNFHNVAWDVLEKTWSSQLRRYIGNKQVVNA